MVPLDQYRRWYRYHHLFADLLRQRLSQTAPAEIHILHERASSWYASFAALSEDETAVDEALHHAVAAQIREQLATLLERFGVGIWERGEHDKLRRWLMLLSDDIMLPRPALNIFRGWLNFASGHYAEAELHLTLAEQMLDDTVSPSELWGWIEQCAPLLLLLKTVCPIQCDSLKKR